MPRLSPPRLPARLPPAGPVRPMPEIRARLRAEGRKPMPLRAMRHYGRVQRRGRAGEAAWAFCWAAPGLSSFLARRLASQHGPR